jgi:hypothetical protein
VIGQAAQDRLTAYRLFYLKAGRICRVETLQCRDDDHAIRTAWRKLGCLRMELWSLDGLIAKFAR